MINKYLTCEQYLENYNKGDKTVVAKLDDSENILVKETSNYTWDDIGYVRPRYTHNYLVGPIAETLHAYEELGYTPEELKKIIEEHKKLKERTLFITTRYGIWNGPTAEKFGDMKADLKRWKKMGDLDIETLYPKLMIASDKMRDEMRKIEHLDEWAKKQIPKPETKPNPAPVVKRAIFNDPATIVFWKDGTKTVVKAQKGETYDPEKGLAMAFSKKMFGNEGNYYDQFTKLLPKEKKVTSADVKAQTFADKLAEDIRDGLKDLYKNIDMKGRGL